jgi:hypothetical protein
MQDAGYAALQVIPTFKGLDANLERGTSKAMTAAGASGGEKFGDAAAKSGGESFTSKIGGLLKKGALAAGGAAGLALGYGIASGLERGRVSDKLAASLGVGERKSKELGEVAGSLYANAYGESFEEVNGAVGAVSASLGDLGKGALKEQTANALNFAAAFDIDVTRAVSSAGNVMKSGLAKNATRAFDLITRASQKVPVHLREDVLDASDEYAQFFDTLGFTGKDAFDVLVSGADKGVYGIDKAGDAIKEFTIRSTDMSTASKASYKAIGLDAEDMADKILKGGDDAKEATDKIIDGLLSIESPSKRANAAIGLFGTPLEDLNVRDIPEFLRSLKGAEDGLDRTSGASRRLGDTLNDNASTKIETFKRQMQTKIIDFVADKFIPLFEDKLLPKLEDFSDWFQEDGLPAIKDFGGDIKPAYEGAKKLARFLGDLPSEAKVAGIAAILGVGAVGKVRGGSGGALGTAGKILGLTKPVPVFVTNMGSGLGSGGSGGGGSKIPFAPILKGAGIIGLEVGAAVGVPLGVAKAIGPKTTQSLGSSGGGFGLGADSDFFDLSDEYAVNRRIEKQKEFVAKLGLEWLATKNKANDYNLFIRNKLPSEIKTNYTVTGIDVTQKKLRDTLALLLEIRDVHMDTRLDRAGGSGGAGQGIAPNPDPKPHGGKRGRTIVPRAGMYIANQTVVAHDYQDFVQQSQRKARGGSQDGW